MLEMSVGLTGTSSSINFTKRLHNLALYFNQFLQNVISIYYIAKPFFCDMFDFPLLIAAICFTVQTYYRAPHHLMIYKLRRLLNRHSHSVCLSFPWCKPIRRHKSEYAKKLSFIPIIQVFQKEKESLGE